MDEFLPTMLDSFELKGRWWLPSNPRSKISGTLRFEPDQHMQLSLIGTLPGSSDKPFEPDLILGSGIESEGSIKDLYTLVRNKQIQRTQGTGRQTQTKKSTYSSQVLLVGQHFREANEFSFRGCELNFTYLEDWLSINPFDSSLFARDAKPSNQYHFTYTVPKGMSFDLGASDMHMRLVWTSYLYSESKLPQRLALSCWPILRLIPKENFRYKDIYPTVFALQNLFALLIGDPVYARVINLATRKIKGPVRMFYPQGSAKIWKWISPGHMPAPYTTIEEKIPSIFQTWFSNSQVLKPVYDLLYGISYGRITYQRTHFLALMQALESFHRVAFPRKRFATEDFREYKQRALAAIPEELPELMATSIKQCIGFSNELGLTERVKEMVKQFPTKTQRIIAGKQTIDQFIKTLVATRNYFTHYGSNPSQHAVTEDNELYDLNDRVAGLIKLSLFRYLNIEENVSVKALFGP
jgi:hypothetical protein